MISIENQDSISDHLLKLKLHLSFLELRISYWDFFLFEKIYSKMNKYLKNSNSSEKNKTLINNKNENLNQSSNLNMRQEKFLLHCEGIHVILIDDIKGLHIQTLDGKIDEFTFTLENWSTSLDAQVTLPIELNFFNIKNSHWEPVVEPWKLDVNIKRQDANSEFNCDLTTKDKLNINICHNTINSLLNTISNLNNKKNRNLESRKIETYPYILRNRTGSDIIIWTESKEANLDIKLVELKNNDELKIKFTNWREMREREKIIENKLNIQIKTDLWETIKSIPVDQEKTISYILRPVINIIYVLVVDIKVIENIKYVTFRSSSILRNRTNLNLDILILNYKTTQYSVGPMEDFYIPITDTFNGRIKVRPKDEKDKLYNWCNEAFNWNNFEEANTIDLNCSSTINNNNMFYFKIYNETTKNRLQKHLNMIFTIVPPFEIENLLPCSLKFDVIADNNKNVLIDSFIYPEKSYSIYECNTNNNLSLSIDIIDFQQKEKCIINNKFGSTDKYIILYNPAGFELKLTLIYLNLKTGTKRISIMSPYIIYNKSELDITIIPKKIINTNTTLNNLPLNKCVIGKLVPNLFSYNNQFISNRVYLKTSSSELSRPISFEAVGGSYNVDIPLANNNKIELGVNVTESQGKYHKVKIVTISPRYIIINNLEDDLLIKQDESQYEYKIKGFSSIYLNKILNTKKKNICLRLLNEENEWTSLINIDSIGTYYLKLIRTNYCKEDLIKVSIILKNATIYISLTKALIWPIKIINEYKDEIIIYQKVNNNIIFKIIKIILIIIIRIFNFIII